MSFSKCFRQIVESFVTREAPKRTPTEYLDFQIRRVEKNSKIVYNPIHKY